MVQSIIPRPQSRIRPRNRQHRCFELAGRYQLDDPTWTLVHGVIESEIRGIPIAHAWLKRDGWVFDPVRNESMPESEYLDRFAASEVGAFSSREAARKTAELGYWGPLVQYAPDVVLMGSRKGGR